MKTINKLVLLEGNEVVLSKEEAIKKLADKLEEAGFLTSCNEFLESVYLREEIAPTTVGYGIGLPHGKGSCVKESAVAFMRVKNPILWNIQDDEKVKIVFMLAVSEEEGKGTHNDILVELSKKILDSNFRNRIENSSSIEEIVKLINE
ncbi:PTS sugar transporter subunit IIA [Fusobacterium mortiferum]|jgi:PTS system fructose-specific IIA component|uniref:PTS sugar transporter subunit IIA n=1 Tax=Fusobacterium mortiferum TaxID=850 RepID=UPI0025FAC1EB|nr:fructose PTS transporter subunit IIA [uncultured Fusobacterium sp.]MCI7665231.1 fructose PTS transporter subunit IIA [Fusobacterium mortiferum]MDD7262349.1 fructose PTS transporter subunit IIA [Fusobacterium mortiferum]MDY2800045.1 fructose PTS transporter subunit IIA [Fusobacterium mortiferum]MDY4801198.1 fructose PTS transporter subunit IIA [Fusobacterium mortiferum]MDY5980713.1 fructose PTS transporter subunit IIA [Fusobacterium mortiferum]